MDKWISELEIRLVKLRFYKSDFFKSLIYWEKRSETFNPNYRKIFKETLTFADFLFLNLLEFKTSLMISGNLYHLIIHPFYHIRHSLSYPSYWIT